MMSGRDTDNVSETTKTDWEALAGMTDEEIDYSERLLLDSRLIFYDCDYGGFCRFFAPKGLYNIAQGCRETTTLGKRNPTQHNPNGVA
uniref:Uncharacterized protein n=1 Tax=Candidatus Kentrum sp. SD TaxID=2126332 RepID=A0A450YK35_9GAMM|nr:MAG: hypothetical protein BECKSD772F_GA0070984_11079 [Candidatus Kentron sp. SD]VFK47773.1 MAG: hypothetical protein BECKSD772E_GA0070983_11059 [Candidatus Kentron sp. SD]